MKCSTNVFSKPIHEGYVYINNPWEFPWYAIDKCNQNEKYVFYQKV